MSHFNGGNWMARLHVNALGIFLNLCGTSCKKDWWIIIHIRCKCFVLFSLIHALYRKHTFCKRRSSIHEKHPISIFSTLYLLSTGHTNLWHQKALARHSWRLTIWTVGQQKTLISSFQLPRLCLSCISMVEDGEEKRRKEKRKESAVLMATLATAQVELSLSWSWG